MQHPWFQLIFEGAQEKTARVAAAYSAMASLYKVDFFDSHAVITTDCVDGIHFTEQNNRDLGAAFSETVRALLSNHLRKGGACSPIVSTADLQTHRGDTHAPAAL
jgi:hypothetical protein